MRLTHFFIDRPIFATVLSLLLMIAGAFVQQTLPIAEYPDIAPPTIAVTATYPGASAEVVSQTVATPIEQEINGVDDMLYMSSQATGDGTLTINVIFKPGTNIDTAQVLVQNRVAMAHAAFAGGRDAASGVTVKKASPDLMMVVHLISPDGTLDAAIHLELRHPAHQGRAGARRRRWRRAGRSARATTPCVSGSIRPRSRRAELTAGEVVAALQAHNVQVAAGAIDQPPAAIGSALPARVQTLGRLDDRSSSATSSSGPTPDGRVDARPRRGPGRAGAQDYTTNAYLDDARRHARS